MRYLTNPYFLISSIRRRLVQHNSIDEPIKVVALLSKSLYVYLIFKIIFLAPLMQEIIQYGTFEFHSFSRHIFFAPISIALFRYELFVGLFIMILSVSVFLKTNYLSGIIIFWFSISLSKLSSQVVNGSDLILNIFLFICIFTSRAPRCSSEKGILFQNLISNSAILLAQIQLALIYLLSGYDKLMSKAWQNGDAIYSIINLTFFQNPFLKLEFSESLCVLLSWSIILFELAFAALVWTSRTRILALVIGVMFHLGIIFILGLVDFGVVMICCYSVFIFKSDEKESYAVPV